MKRSGSAGSKTPRPLALACLTAARACCRSPVSARTRDVPGRGTASTMVAASRNGLMLGQIEVRHRPTCRELTLVVGPGARPRDVGVRLVAVHEGEEPPVAIEDLVGERKEIAELLRRLAERHLEGVICPQVSPAATAWR